MEVPHQDDGGKGCGCCSFQSCGQRNTHKQMLEHLQRRATGRLLRRRHTASSLFLPRHSSESALGKEAEEEVRAMCVKKSRMRNQTGRWYAAEERWQKVGSALPRWIAPPTQSGSSKPLLSPELQQYVKEEMDMIHT